MDARGVVRHLIEEPEDPPPDLNVDIPNIGHYAGPVEFDQHVRDILDYARSLKKQAEEAGAFAMFRVRSFRPMDIDRAFLTIAVEKYNEEMVQPAKIAKILRREMHSIWD